MSCESVEQGAFSLLLQHTAGTVDVNKNKLLCAQSLAPQLWNPETPSVILAWTVNCWGCPALYMHSCESAARALLDWHLQFSEANYREKIKCIDWFNCQLTTHFWFCGGVFSFFMCSSPQGGLSPGPLELVRIQFLFQRKHSSNLAWYNGSSHKERLNDHPYCLNLLGDINI